MVNTELCHRLLVASLASLASTAAFLTPHAVTHWPRKSISQRTGNQASLHVALRSATNEDDKDIIQTMDILGISATDKDAILSNLQRAGLWEPPNETNSSNPNTLGLLAQDFVDRPEAFSSILINDFDFPPLAAHQTRAVVMSVVKKRMSLQQQRFTLQQIGKNEVGLSQQQLGAVAPPIEPKQDHGTAIEPWTVGRGQKQSIDIDEHQSVENKTAKPNLPKIRIISNIEGPSMPSDEAQIDQKQEEEAERKPKKLSRFKATIINEKAKARRKNGEYEYALDDGLYPLLANDLQAFFLFMTRPSPHSQEDPIRGATAEVYMRHARQFLGWYVTQEKRPVSSSESKPEVPSNENLSLQDIIPNKEQESANDIIDFVLWLRSRDVSVSYEANILRGLTKLLKFRFSRESQTDSAQNGNTFSDIPLIKEIRKLHRDANMRQKLAPRSSNEQKKWLSWPEYLQVIKELKQELLDLMEQYFQLQSKVQKVKVAEAYQCYLILSLFASIPDRQRTMRELAIGTTLVKSEETDGWTVRHGPDDYKTGKSYGERPTMQLREDLSLAIDDYIDNWRSALEPTTDFLFVQSRTGKPLTADGIFQRVSRSCFKYGGKRTNPHLLRDMIVTHVRESDASEKELEALALYMGHSISMQRSSYDRRTLTTKIAPAVELMRSINTDA
ncbi:unnamed protein product [Cylindrotheca closterium]|uniref:Tyr recombinase domain-containing protein n=1 Tax=Cylindrotheca closterium TaxID=2856 RepID=A0AAD2G0E8_9STRA|nr:unnamed protein product [Cylindrotheca closterium]